MSVEHGRIARFVSAARTLLLLQLLAAMLAIGIAAWAFVEVRGLASERDRLKMRVAELESQRGLEQPVGPAVPLGPDPAFNQILPPSPPADLNLIAPPAAPSDLNGLAPSFPTGPATPVAPVVPAPAPAPGPAPRAQQEPPTAAPEPGAPVRRWDCSGANAQNPRCRPLMDRPNLPLNELEPRGPSLGPRTNPGGEAG